MAHSSLQVCMDPNDWLQGTMSEEISSAGLDSSLSSPSGGGTTSDCMLAAACSSRVDPTLMERRLRPPLDHNLKCPRCDSTHTKFCYYNNYSLSQPRYFCKTCRRYWTKGGTLRNIPVGGGCRKTNKKSSNSKKGNIIIDPHHHHHHHPCIISQGGGGLVSSNANDHLQQLSFPEVQFPPHLAHLIGAQMSHGGGSFMDNGFLRPIDFMESKYDFMGWGNNNNIGHGGQEFGVFGGIGDQHLATNYGLTSNFDGVNINSSTSQFNHDGNLGISFMDQRMLLPYDGNDNNNTNDNQNGVDVKPNPKLLSLEWQDQGCNSSVGVGNGNGNGKDSSYGYNLNDSSNWTAMMGGFQASTTNSLA